MSFSTIAFARFQRRSALWRLLLGFIFLFGGTAALVAQDSELDDDVAMEQGILLYMQEDYSQALEKFASLKTAAATQYAELCRQSLTAGPSRPPDGLAPESGSGANNFEGLGAGQIANSRGYGGQSTRGPPPPGLPDRRWNFTVLTGYQYDSNVSLLPEFSGLGADTGKEDSAWTIVSLGDFRLVQQEERNVGVIMSTFDDFYFNLNDFDTQDYMGGAYTNWALGNWIAGVRYEYHDTLVDYQQFAGQHRLVPNLTLREGTFGHTTLYYEFDSTDYQDVPLIPAQEQSGNSNMVGFTQAIYTFGGQGRLFFGYHYESANTQGSDFDRRTHMLTARVERPLNERLIFDAEYREFFDYYPNAQSLDFFGRSRTDQRPEVRAGLQYFMNAHVSFRLDYTFITQNSNIENLFGVPFFQYDRHLLNTNLIYDF